MESSRNSIINNKPQQRIIKGGQNGVKSQLISFKGAVMSDYKGGAKWSQVATNALIE